MLTRIRKLLWFCFKWTVVLLLVVALLVGFKKGSRSLRNASLSQQEKYIEDLDQLERLIKEEHIRPYWKRPETELDTLINVTRRKLYEADPSKMDHDAIITDYYRILAWLGDGHSDVLDRYQLFGKHPFFASWYPEGVIITRTGVAYENALGARIVAIEDTPWEKAEPLIKPIVNSANQSGYRWFMPYVLNKALLLRGLGLNTNQDSVTLTLQKGEGIPFKITFPTLTPEEDTSVEYVNASDRLIEGDKPLFMTNRDQNYFYEHLPESRTIYVNYRSVQNMESQDIKTFASLLFDFVDQNPTDRFILDVRQNTGGNNYLNAPLLKGILDRPAINSYGKLFVITGRHTFSAAINLVGDLETKTKAIFIGEPIGDHINSPGDAAQWQLEHTGFKFQLSTLFWVNSWHDKDGINLTPDITITKTWDQFVKGEDPALEQALSWVPKETKPFIAVEPQPYLGRWQFTPDRALVLTRKDDRLQISITGKVVSDLYPKDARTYQTDLTDLELYLAENGAVEVISGGEKRSLLRLGNDQLTALEMVASGKKAEALETYRQLKARYPRSPFLHANNLSMQGWYILKTTGNEEAAMTLWEINKELHPDVLAAHNVLAMRNWEKGNKIGALGHALSASRIYMIYKFKTWW